MKLLFWLSIGWIFYAYLGYLFILIVKSKFNQTKIMREDGFFPSISLIISAYNEEGSIKNKIEESLNLDYPENKLEIIIASDASTDRTEEIVGHFTDEAVRLIRQDVRKGKTAVQNLAASIAKGEILVFSDATTVFKPDALKKLVRNFKDPKVGCVGGEERFLKTDKEIYEEASFFWKFEQLLRKKESQFNTLIGVSGCIFAIRKELYEPLDETLIEDFALPLKVASRGFKVIYESEAVGYERPASHIRAELSRKSRIVTGGINVLFKMRGLLNPFRHPLLSFQLISHKIFRWFAPIFMVALLISNIFLLNQGKIYLIFGLLQTSFYTLALMGYFLKNLSRSPKIFRLVYHFCIINLAGVMGIIDFLRGGRKVIWQPIR